MKDIGNWNNILYTVDEKKHGGKELFVTLSLDDFNTMRRFITTEHGRHDWEKERNKQRRNGERNER